MQCVPACLFIIFLLVTLRSKCTLLLSIDDGCRYGETRCLRRKDLIDTLFDALPPATVKFGYQLESIKIDPNTTKPVLRFIDGSSIIPKVLTRLSTRTTDLSVLMAFMKQSIWNNSRLHIQRKMFHLSNYFTNHPRQHDNTTVFFSRVLVRGAIRKISIYRDLASSSC